METAPAAAMTTRGLTQSGSELRGASEVRSLVWPERVTDVTGPACHARIVGSPMVVHDPGENVCVGSR